MLEQGALYSVLKEVNGGDHLASVVVYESDEHALHYWKHWPASIVKSGIYTSVSVGDVLMFLGVLELEAYQRAGFKTLAKFTHADRIVYIDVIHLHDAIEKL
jgi:hypothetical protein